MELAVCQPVIDCRKLLHLHFFPAKGTDHADTIEVFPGGSSHTVQIFLHRFVLRIGDLHHTKDDHKEHANCRHKDQRQLDVNGKHHDHRTKDDKGRAQKQTQEHIDTVLHLVDIAGHAGDQRRSTNGIQFCEAKGLDMGKQITTQSGRRADGRFGRKKLSGKAASKTQQRHKQHQGKVRPNHLGIAGRNTIVNDPCHQDRHGQIKARLQHFECRRQNALPLIFFHIGF